jgi:hypothetical protein
MLTDSGGTRPYVWFDKHVARRSGVVSIDVHPAAVDPAWGAVAAFGDLLPCERSKASDEGALP